MQKTLLLWQAFPFFSFYPPPPPILNAWAQPTLIYYFLYKTPNKRHVCLSVGLSCLPILRDGCAAVVLVLVPEGANKRDGRLTEIRTSTNRTL